MNKSILDALMRLFAIIANVEGGNVSGTARNSVSSYLKQRFNQHLVDLYLSRFDKYISYYHKSIENHNVEAEKKELALKSLRVEKICGQINEELEQEQKILVLVELFEFIKKNFELSNTKQKFIKTVGKALKIEQDEYENIRTFIFETTQAIPQKDKVLVANDNVDFRHPQIKHLYNNTLKGQVVFLYIKSTNTYLFKYLGKRNIYLNGHNIKINKSYVFAQGALIKSSKIRPIYYGQVSSKFIEDSIKTKLNFIAKDVEFKFKSGDIGIHKFSFTEHSGQFLGILGGSGSGKSTLINVLNGNLELSSGEIIINGYNLHKDKEILNSVIGYVPQDDLLIEELTVFQNLYYNAKLCFNDLSEEEIVRTVDLAIVDFDLYEARDLIVGNPLNKFISGGQRKRLNIALELIREPSILFIDEPTSGLSSMDAEKVIFLLKKQSLKGKLIIAVIHQPSSDVYKLLDRLFIIDKGGHIIYNGNPIDAIVYFRTLSNHVNASESECLACGVVKAEQPLRIVESRMVNEYGKLTRIRKVTPEEWYELYLNNLQPKHDKRIAKQLETTQKNAPLPKNNFKIPGRLKQFKLFSVRDILSKLYNRQYLLINLLEAPLLAIILGYFTKFIIGTDTNIDQYIFSENKNLPAYLFMAVIVALFLGLSVSANEIIKDKKILTREAFLNLSRFSYINSKLVIMFFVSAIQTLMFIVVGNWILEIESMTLSYWLILFSTSCAANLMGLNISSAFNSVTNIYVLIPFILVPQILFSGVIVNFNDLHKNLTSQIYVPVIGDLMISRWAYEALTVEQFKNNEYHKYFNDAEQQISHSTYYTAFLIPRLQAKADECLRNISKKQDENETVENLAILRNSLESLSKNNVIKINDIDRVLLDSLKLEFFNKSIFAKTKVLLTKVKSGFAKKLVIANKLKKNRYDSLVNKLGSTNAVYELKQKYHNKNLADLMLNRMNPNKIVEIDNMFVQRKDPIYMYPEHNYGRAHFYAPAKKFMGRYYETFYFNLSLIWILSVVLYFILLFDMFGRLSTYIENLKFRK